MASTIPKTRRNRTFRKPSNDLATSRNGRHAHFSSDNILKLKVNTAASMYHHPYSTTTTPITSSLTPGTTIFRVSLQEMRNRKNKKPKLQQSQTDNYYNTTNPSLPHHTHTYIHRQSHSNITHSNITNSSHGSDTETEDESTIMTDAYAQYKPTGSFPDTYIDPIHHETTSSDHNNWRDKYDKMESKMKILEQELAAKNKKIDDLAYKLNNNVTLCADYSGNEDGDITDEGETEYDDDDDNEDEEDINNIEIKKKNHEEKRGSGWIEKTGNMYGSHRNSKVLEIKMSELFEQTAEKFLAFLKQDEVEKELESKEKEKIMLELLDKVKENENLNKENKTLIKHNKKWEEEVIYLRTMRESLNKQIWHLQQQLNRNKITMGEQKEVIRNFRVAQFENDSTSQYQQYYQHQQSSNIHKRSATETVSIDINRVFSAIDDNADNDNNNKHNNDTLSAPKFLRAHSIGPDAPTELKQHEIELYELLKSFIETHKEQNTSSLQLPNYNNYSSVSTEDDDIKEKEEEEEEEERIFDENEIMSFDNLDTPRSLNADRSEASNQSIPSTQLTMDDVVSNDNNDFSKDDDGNEYKLNNMDNNNNNNDDDINNIDGSCQPNINRLKSISYWKDRMDEQIESSRHRLTVSRQNIENGIVHRLKRQFDATPSWSEQCDVNNLSLSNLGDKPEELIRDLSNKTNLAITSTHRRRTTKAKHKHKRKPKNARSNTLEDDDDDNKDKRIKKPEFRKDISWRETMNKQNSERCKNLRKRTPRNSMEYIDTGKGAVNIEKSSLSKITELLRRQYKYNGNKKQKD